MLFVDLSVSLPELFPWPPAPTCKILIYKLTNTVHIRTHTHSHFSLSWLYTPPATGSSLLDFPPSCLSETRHGASIFCNILFKSYRNANALVLFRVLIPFAFRMTFESFYLSLFRRGLWAWLRFLIWSCSLSSLRASLGVPSISPFFLSSVSGEAQPSNGGVHPLCPREGGGRPAG